MGHCSFILVTHGVCTIRPFLMAMHNAFQGRSTRTVLTAYLLLHTIGSLREFCQLDTQRVPSQLCKRKKAGRAGLYKSLLHP